MMETMQSLFLSYGYVIIFLVLFCGLIGIPAAEESFLLFVGVTLPQLAADGERISVTLCILIAALGASSGMVSAYLIGYYIGKPFILRFGKYIGLTEERWRIARGHFQNHTFLAIMGGYFIPGIRQINPYLAGISRARFAVYLPASIIGALIWATVFLLLGYFMGDQIHRFWGVGLVHVVLIGAVLFIGFVTVTAIQFRKK